MMEKPLFVVVAFCCIVFGSSLAFAQDGDPAAGVALYHQCAACHSVEEGAHRTVGPSLYGIMGSTAGTVEGYEYYSEAMKNSGITWDEETMSAFLEDPRGYMPGNRMPYAGLRDEQDRADLIAYLATLGED